MRTQRLNSQRYDSVSLDSIVFQHMIIICRYCTNNDKRFSELFKDIVCDWNRTCDGIAKFRYDFRGSFDEDIVMLVSLALSNHLFFVGNQVSGIIQLHDETRNLPSSVWSPTRTEIVWAIRTPPSDAVNFLRSTMVSWPSEVFPLRNPRWLQPARQWNSI